jgi:hypothetical protein
MHGDSACIMRRTIDQVASAVDIEGFPIASEAVLVKGKLSGYHDRILCGIPQDYLTRSGLLVHGTI